MVSFHEPRGAATCNWSGLLNRRRTWWRGTPSDEATLVVTYPKAQAIIQASWNWPFDRKDIEIYGRTGHVLVPRAELMRVRKANSVETEVPAPAVQGAQADPLSYLAAVVRGELKPLGLVQPGRKSGRGRDSRCRTRIS